jgi:hypothetical protein
VGFFCTGLKILAMSAAKSPPLSLRGCCFSSVFKSLFLDVEDSLELLVESFGDLSSSTVDSFYFAPKSVFWRLCSGFKLASPEIRLPSKEPLGACP